MSEASGDVQQNTIEVTSHYVRGRHVMVLFADFGNLYVDYYLHLMQQGLRLEPEHDAMLKDALAAMTLHLTSRPREEMTAWTMNFREPPLNLFVTGDSRSGNVVGRVFTRDVRVGGTSLFFSQVTHPRNPVRRSTVEVTGRNVLDCVEQFYARSEQLPARLFPMEGDAYAMAVAQPDYDRKWFRGLDAPTMARLPELEELGLLERRAFHFACGCQLDTVLELLHGIYKGDLDEMFGDEAELHARCPRCASTFLVDRPRMLAWVERKRAAS